MRRGSLIGPMLLILIGVLFLVNNLRPELPILQIIGNYWPYLLIGWGALRLIEITYWQLSGRPLPVNGVSGGEWGLVIFLTIIGTALFYGHRYAGSWPPGRIGIRGIDMLGESFDFQLPEQKRAVGKTPRILIENLRGNARIVGADSEELKVVGRTTVRAFQQADAERVYKEAPLEVVTQGNLLVVRTNQDRPSGPQRITSDLEITVPMGAIVQARGRYGDFDFAGIAGVDVDSDNAGVRANNVSGNVRADLRKSDSIRFTNIGGNVDLKGSGWDVELENVAGPATVNGSYSGELIFRNLAKPLRFESHQTEMRVEKIPGEMRMSRGTLTGHGVEGPVVVKTGSKDVDMSDFTNSLEVVVDRGDIDLRPGKLPLAKMEIRSKSGNIHLAVPAAAKFQMRASTTRGEIDNEFGAPLMVDEAGRGAKMTGAAGGGGAEIDLVAERGSVTVRKVTADSPEAPAAPKPVAAPKTPAGLKVEQQ